MAGKLIGQVHSEEGGTPWFVDAGYYRKVAPSAGCMALHIPDLMDVSWKPHSSVTLQRFNDYFIIYREFYKITEGNAIFLAHKYLRMSLFLADHTGTE